MPKRRSRPVEENLLDRPRTAGPYGYHFGEPMCLVTLVGKKVTSHTPVARNYLASSLVTDKERWLLSRDLGHVQVDFIAWLSAEKIAWRNAIRTDTAMNFMVPYWIDASRIGDALAWLEAHGARRIEPVAWLKPVRFVPRRRRRASTSRRTTRR